MKNICWDVDKFPFCLCGDGDEDPLTGCSDPVEKFTTHYITSSEVAVYNGSFSNPFIAMVRLVVLISTENYPDVMCKCAMPQTTGGLLQLPPRRGSTLRGALDNGSALLSACTLAECAHCLNRQPTHTFFYSACIQDN